MISLIVKFNVKPECTEAFKIALLTDKKGSEQESDCEEMKLFEDKKDPSVIFAYERWKDPAAVDFHNAQPYTKKVFELIDTALQSPAEIMKLGETNPAPNHDLKHANPEDEIFIIFFIFKIKEDYREQVLKQFEKHVASTRKEEEGNILFDLYTINGQNDTLAVYEHWRKESDVWDIHFKQPYAIETGNLLNDAVVGDMEQYMNFVTEIA